MYNVVYNGNIIDSNINCLIVPKVDDLIAAGGKVYKCQAVDMIMGQGEEEEDMLQNINVTVVDLLNARP